MKKSAIRMVFAVFCLLASTACTSEQVSTNRAAVVTNEVVSTPSVVPELSNPWCSTNMPVSHERRYFRFCGVR